MALAGKRAWWLPAWLDRLLPSIDVDGSQVAADRPTPEGGHDLGRELS
jgi:RND superfamily putative drug exporter